MMTYEYINLSVKKIANGFVTKGGVKVGYGESEADEVFSPDIEGAIAQLLEIIGRADEMAARIDPKMVDF